MGLQNNVVWSLWTRVDSRSFVCGSNDAGRRSFGGYFGDNG